jgi:NAD(P)-dependent dehydrogenase (short-subunit alcohol dehydrogenase family)
MQQTADRSLRELQRETEQTRAGLTHTVDQLKASVTDTASEIRQRISPEHIKAEVSNYVRSAYATTKGAIQNFTGGLAQMLAARGSG